MGVSAFSQVDPLSSPYYQEGSLSVTSETLTDATPALLTYRPTTGGDYPVLLFQPGANGFGDDAIDVNTYDLYMEHLASYGYVVVVIDDMQGGPNGKLICKCSR
jgi:predicted dienelactone hydrolase